MSTETPRIHESKRIIKNQIDGYLKDQSFVILIDINKTSTKLLNEIRFLQKDLNFSMGVYPRRIFLLSLKESDPKAHEILKDKIQMQNLFIIGKGNPIKLAIELSKLEIQLPAKPNDSASDDIIVEAGNTGFPAGPVIGVFTESNIPTRITNGSIHISKTITVARKNDSISVALSNVLTKLGIKPIKGKLNFKAGYDFENNLFLENDVLVPNINEYVNTLKKLVNNAFKLSIEINYPTKENIPSMISQAQFKAKVLANKLEYISPDTIQDLISTSVSKANLLENKIQK